MSFTLSFFFLRLSMSEAAPSMNSLRGGESSRGNIVQQRARVKEGVGIGFRPVLAISESVEKKR